MRNWNRKADTEEHGSLQNELSAPHGTEPIEDFDSRGDPDNHGGDGEKTVGVGIHADGEHVVGPDAHADKADANGGRDHHGITKNGFA